MDLYTIKKVFAIAYAYFAIRDTKIRNYRKLTDLPSGGRIRNLNTAHRKSAIGHDPEPVTSTFQEVPHQNVVCIYCLPI